jgi:uncharacterized protein
MKKIITLCFLALPLFIQANTISPTVPTIALSAQGTIYKPADELQMNIGVVTFKDTAEEALHENSQKIAAVIESLKASGLTNLDYETGHFSINPTYTPYPKNPPPDWKQSINGYEVSNTIFIHTSQINSAGKIIDAANQAGANNINAISFVLHDPRTYWNEALTLAVENAINDAQIIAKAANLKLVRVLSIAMENNHYVAPRGGAYAAKISDYSNIPSIEAGEVKITANVNLTYEITPGF